MSSNQGRFHLKIEICCFSAKPAASRSKIKDWLAMQNIVFNVRLRVFLQTCCLRLLGVYVKYQAKRIFVVIFIFILYSYLKKSNIRPVIHNQFHTARIAYIVSHLVWNIITLHIECIIRGNIRYRYRPRWCNRREGRLIFM